MLLSTHILFVSEYISFGVQSVRPQPQTEEHKSKMTKMLADRPQTDRLTHARTHTRCWVQNISCNHILTSDNTIFLWNHWTSHLYLWLLVTTHNTQLFIYHVKVCSPSYSRATCAPQFSHKHTCSRSRSFGIRHVTTTALQHSQTILIIIITVIFTW